MSARTRKRSRARAAESFAETRVKTGDLTKEQARPSVGAINNAQRSSEAQRLTPERLACIMRDADQGEVTAYLTLCEEMEERESHYRSVLSTRKLGVSGADVSVETPDDSAHNSAITEHVEELVQRPEFESLVLDLMDGVAKSFSCVEIVWNRDGKLWEPERYEFRPQRFFTFDRDTMSQVRLRTFQEPTYGEALQPFKWLVHTPKLASGVTIRTGIARPVATAYACKRFTVQDWMAFLEVFGMPVRVGKYPAHMADRAGELKRAVQQIGIDAAGIIPSEMSIEFIDSKSGSGGTTLFQQSAEYWDAQISKVVLGQTMTSDDGASLAQSKTHERVRFDIRKADARSVAATINRDLIKPFVDLNYGPQDVYPKVKIHCEEPEDTTALMGVVKVFVGMGGKVQMSEIRDRLGLMEPEEDAELLTPEGAALMALTPKPEAPEPDQDETATGDEPADDTDEATGEPGAGGKKAELNRALTLSEPFAAKPKTADELDRITDDAIDDWEPLLDGTVGECMRRLAMAESYDEARAVLDELQAARADLDIGPLVASLAKRQFQAAGLGDSTDSVEV